MTTDERMIRDFTYQRRLIPNRYVAAMDRGVQTTEQALARTGLSIGYPGWNLLYYATLCGLSRTGANMIVETGTNWGFSTIMLAQALLDSGLAGHVHSVEANEQNHEKARTNIERARVAHLITLHLGDAKAFLQGFVPHVDGTIRVAFIDGSHAQDDVVSEFAAIHPKIDDDSTVFFDNTYKIADDGEADQRVNGALRIILDRYGGNLVNFPNCSWFTPGQAIWQKAPFLKDWT